MARSEHRHPAHRVVFDTSFSNIEWVMNAYISCSPLLLVPMGRFR